MEIIKSLETIRIDEPTVVALGNFDGVHQGHQLILKDAIDYAKEHNIKSACYTFSNHPVNFFMNKTGQLDKCVKLICTEEEKLATLEKLGFDIVINVEFNEDIMKMRAMDFIYDILKDRLSAKAVCCGFNYTYGVKAEGDVDLLRKEGAKIGMDILVRDAKSFGDTVISSTEIRKLIASGDMEMLTEYLGRHYTLSGVVEHGLSLGREIGFPTMNIEAPMTMALPPNGVYFTNAIIDGRTYPAITNIGVKPTVEESNKVKNFETNIFNFHENAYDKFVKIEFLKWERPEIKFESIDALREQISKDVKLAKEYHNI